ncbi:LysR family transcriptional regulator, partial [Rhodopseudomonas palustris]
AALPSVAATFLPRVIVDFQAQNPGIVIDVLDVVGEEIIKLVKAEDVDFGIGTRISSDKGIKVQDYLSDSLCAFFPAEHPLNTSMPVVQIKDFAPYPLVLTRKNSSVRVLFEWSMEREGCELNIAMESNYMSTALGMVRAGVGVAILPSAAAELGNMTGLCFKPVESPQFNRRVGIIRKTDRTLQPLADHFIDALLRMTSLRADDSFDYIRHADTVSEPSMPIAKPLVAGTYPGQMCSIASSVSAAPRGVMSRMR